MREHLLGYLLGALEPSEAEVVERRLETDPELRRVLGLLEQRLGALKCLDDCDAPPAGLADRTCSRICEQTSDPSRPRDAHLSLGDNRRADAPHKVMLPAAVDPPAGAGWSLADLLVAACIVLAAGVLFFPAIASSRHNSQLTQCRNNLRMVGVALASYSDLSAGRFPSLPTEGKLSAAGLYGPILRKHELLPDTSKVVCPASALAQQMDKWHLATIEELEQASGALLAQLKSQMGGSYAYSLGYMEDGRYRAPRNMGRQFFALLGDAPCSTSATRQSANHGGYGQNVLFEDQSVRYMVSCTLAHLADDIFQNHDGLVAAGVDLNDSVLAESSTGPLGDVSLRK